MIYKFGFDGSKESARSGLIKTNEKNDSIDTIEVIVNGKTLYCNHATYGNNIKVFDFRVGVDGLEMSGDKLLSK